MPRSGALSTLVVAALAMVPVAARAEAPPPSEVGVEIGSLSYSGSGCPQGSAAVIFSADRQEFTVLYSAFALETGPGLAGAARKDCQLHLKMRIPKGWSYALTNVDFSGFAALDPGVVASLESRYHLSGEGPVRVDALELAGPYEPNDYVHRDAFPDGSLSSACGKGKNVQIKTSVRISNKPNPEGAGVIFVDATDGALQQTYRLAWTRCK